MRISILFFLFTFTFTVTVPLICSAKELYNGELVRVTFKHTKQAPMEPYFGHQNDWKSFLNETTFSKNGRNKYVLDVIFQSGFYDCKTTPSRVKGARKNYQSVVTGNMHLKLRKIRPKREVISETLIPFSEIQNVSGAIWGTCQAEMKTVQDVVFEIYKLQLRKLNGEDVDKEIAKLSQSMYEVKGEGFWGNVAAGAEYLSYGVKTVVWGGVQVLNAAAEGGALQSLESFNSSGGLYSAGNTKADQIMRDNIRNINQIASQTITNREQAKSLQQSVQNVHQYGLKSYIKSPPQFAESKGNQSISKEDKQLTNRRRELIAQHEQREKDLHDQGHNLPSSSFTASNNGWDKYNNKNTDKPKSQECVARTAIGGYLPEAGKRYCKYTFDEVQLPITVSYEENSELQLGSASNENKETAIKWLKQSLRKKAERSCENDGYDNVFSTNYELNKVDLENNHCKVIDGPFGSKPYLCEGSADFICGKYGQDGYSWSANE